MKCPNCDFESPPEMRFCGMCGASLTLTCPECQFVNPVNYRFCGMCGSPLLVEMATRPASTPRFSQLAPTRSPVTPQNALNQAAAGNEGAVSAPIPVLAGE